MNGKSRKGTTGRIRKKNRYAMCVVVIALVIALGCGGYAVNYYASLHERENQFAALRDLTLPAVPEISIETETEADGEIIVADRIHDFDELRETNSDIYAWVSVPGTDVDYPVLQNETDNYYLNHNLDHSQGYPGCIYTNQINAEDFTDLLTVLYGHDMRSTGTMFHSLHMFEDPTFFAENQSIIVYTEDERLTYTICAASRFSDIYIPALYDVVAPDGRAAFLEQIRIMAVGDLISHTREITDEYADAPIIILSTCIKNEEESRYLIVGVLTETAPYAETIASK